MTSTSASDNSLQNAKPTCLDGRKPEELQLPIAQPSSGHKDFAAQLRQCVAAADETTVRAHRYSTDGLADSCDDEIILLDKRLPVRSAHPFFLAMASRPGEVL